MNTISGHRRSPGCVRDSRIEELRNEWVSEYDFVLVDSRTGVTDIGGICTVHLADVLVLLFTTTESSMEGAMEILERARKAQGRLPPFAVPGFHAFWWAARPMETDTSVRATTGERGAVVMCAAAHRPGRCRRPVERIQNNLFLPYL
jgi:hypothetical protein